MIAEIARLLEIGLDLIIKFGSMPHIYAFVLGILMTLVFTQFAKFCLVKTWPDWIVRVIAFTFGFGATFFIVPDVPGFILASIVGFASPWLYPVLTRWIYHRWPWWRAILSRDGGVG